jgi:hypothetical protein
MKIVEPSVELINAPDYKTLLKQTYPVFFEDIEA